VSSHEERSELFWHFARNPEQPFTRADLTGLLGFEVSVRDMNWVKYWIENTRSPVHLPGWHVTHPTNGWEGWCLTRTRARLAKVASWQSEGTQGSSRVEHQWWDAVAAAVNGQGQDGDAANGA
jgi:hypothetical protein